MGTAALRARRGRDVFLLDIFRRWFDRTPWRRLYETRIQALRRYVSALTIMSERPYWKCFACCQNNVGRMISIDKASGNHEE
jgi:hypothetical protein